MEKLQYKLSAFEGPLDLLLTLIQKNKVSIWDIPIAEITEQYLEAIEGIEEEEIDDTSEFLVLAAQLLWIKSRMLLPKDEEEEEEDPREDLARRLAEYQAYKEASAELRKTEGAADFMVFREEENIKFPVPEYSREHTIEDLMNAFQNILARQMRKAKVEKRAFSGIVGREKVSVHAMSTRIKRRFLGSKKVNFTALFEENDSRPVMIATFLAVLDMIKGNKLFAEYDAKKGDYILTTSYTKKELEAEDTEINDEEY